MHQQFRSVVIVAAILFMAACTQTDSGEQAGSFIERSERYEAQGQYRAALIEVRNAIQANPTEADYGIRYAQLLMTLGNPQQAEKILGEYRDQLDKVRLPLVEALLQQGKFVSAKTLLAGWQPNGAEQHEFSRLNAIQTYLQGDRDEALKSLIALASQPGAPLAAQKTLIRLSLQSQLNKEASEWVQRLVNQHPDDADLRYYQARIAYQNNNLSEAEQSLTLALKQMPTTDMMLSERLRILELLSNVLAELGRIDDAYIYSRLIQDANPIAFAAQEQFKEALASASEGDLSAAKTAFEDILAQFPNNQQAALMLGLIHLEEGDTALSEALLSTNLDPETAPPTMVGATALAQMEQGKSAEALAVLETALIARPDDVSLLALYGMVSLNANKEQQGVKAISKALQLDPTRTRLNLLLAQYYDHKNMHSHSLGHLRKAYQQDATDWPTTSYYLTQLNEHNEAGELTSVRDQISQNYSDSPDALWVLAILEMQQNHNEPAIRLLEKVHTLAPADVKAIQALAELYERSKQYTRACGMWLKALEQNPSDGLALSRLISLKEAGNTPSDTLAWLLTEAESKPQVALPLHALAIDRLISRGELAKAKTLAEPYQGLDQPIAKRIQAALLRGDALLAAQQEDWASALNLAEQALLIAPSETSLILLASQIEVRFNRPDAALARLNEALVKQPESTRLILSKTALLNTIRDGQSALQFLQGHWQKSPNGTFAASYFQLLRRHKPEALATAVNDLLQAEPSNAYALSTQAGLHLDAGEMPKAEALYKKVLEIDPDAVLALNNLAWLISQNDPQSALPYAEKAAQLAPQSASVLDTYGWILHQAGDQQTAREVLQRALEIDPENESIREHHAAASGEV